MPVKGFRELPVIGVSSVPREVPTGYGTDWADTTAVGLTAGVMRAGGVPVVLPVVAAELSPAQLRGLDGLVLSGGQDLDLPLPPGAPAEGRWIHPARDEHEFALWAAARELGLPVLGVCRGMQLVNVALGGELVRHVDGHDRAAAHRERLHPVRVDGDSRLAAALGADRADVNTIHHQALGALGNGLRATAWADDGVVEAAEGTPGDGWFVGVQWHPELMLDLPGGQPLFDALVREAASRLAAAA
jgi:putative glutamine amidotransferase